jgi:hypothetical protein
MTFVCDPLSIILIVGLIFVFVLLAILLAYAIIVMRALARITRQLRAVSDEVESLLLKPIDLLQSLVEQIKRFIKGQHKEEKNLKKRRKKKGTGVNIKEGRAGEFEIKEVE